MIFSPLLRVNLASLAAQIVQVGGFPILLAFALDALDQNEAVIGVIVTLPWLAVLVGAGFLPRIIRRTNERVTALLGVVVSLAALGLLLWSVTVITLSVAALLMGVGLVLRWVACDTWIVQLAPDAMRGRAIGLHETLMGLGIAIGPALLLIRDQIAWDPVALFSFCLVFAFGLFAIAPLGRADRDAPPPAVAGGGRRLSLMLLMPICAALLSGVAETSSVALLPLWFVDQGMREPLALSLLISFGIGGTLLQLPLGTMADRWGVLQAERLCAVGLMLGAGANLLLLEYSVTLLYACVFLWGGAIGGLNTLAVIQAGARTSGADTSRAMAAVASAYTGGGVIGPAILGALWSVAGPQAVMAGLAALGLGYLVLCSVR